MVDKNEILIRFYRNGETKSEISRDLGISRKTVRRYIREHDLLRSSSDLKNHLEAGLSTKPVYKSGHRQKVKLTIEVKNQIDYYLQKNAENRSQGLHKQLMKKFDIHQELIKQGYDIGYSSVCNYVRRKEFKSKEAFIKQIYSPGSSCEFDWGEVKLFFEGQRKTLNLAVFTCCYSNYRYAKLFYRQDTLAFSQSHIDFFSQLKGVPKEMVYDNMKVAVKSFVGRTEKEATKGLLELSNYYHFNYRFCNVRKGNEKGHVERSVEYIRRKTFSSTTEFSNIDEANKYLEQRCNELNKYPQKLLNDKTAHELIDDEQKYLYKVNTPYKCFIEDYGKVDKYSTVTYQGNRYSVPDNLVGKMLDVKIFAEKIAMLYNKAVVCVHPRSYGAHTWTLDISHYLNTLLKKPGALAGSLALQQADSYFNDIYTKYFKNESRSFLELLKYCNDNNIDIDMLKSAIKKVIQITSHDVSKDKIIVILEYDDTIIDKTYEKDQIEACSSELLDELSSLITNY